MPRNRGQWEYRLSVTLFVAASALVLGAVAAAVTGYEIWGRTAVQPTVAEAGAVVQGLLPGARVSPSDGVVPTDGAPLLWDEETDGGYTGVVAVVEGASPGEVTLPQRLVASMRAAGWSTRLVPETSEVSGNRDGLFLYATADYTSYDVTLVRASWPAMRVAVAAAWGAGAVLGAGLALTFAGWSRRRATPLPTGLTIGGGSALGFAALLALPSTLGLVDLLRSSGPWLPLEYWSPLAFPLLLILMMFGTYGVAVPP